MLPVCEQEKIAGAVVGFPASWKSSRGPSPVAIWALGGSEFARGIGAEYSLADQGVLDSCARGSWRI